MRADIVITEQQKVINKINSMTEFSLNVPNKTYENVKIKSLHRSNNPSKWYDNIYFDMTRYYNKHIETVIHSDGSYEVLVYLNNE